MFENLNSVQIFKTAAWTLVRASLEAGVGGVGQPPRPHALQSPGAPSCLPGRAAPSPCAGMDAEHPLALIT